MRSARQIIACVAAGSKKGRNLSSLAELVYRLQSQVRDDAEGTIACRGAVEYVGSELVQLRQALWQFRGAEGGCDVEIPTSRCRVGPGHIASQGSHAMSLAVLLCPHTLALSAVGACSGFVRASSGAGITFLRAEAH